jgi:hypothetical protein
MIVGHSVSGDEGKAACPTVAEGGSMRLAPFALLSLLSLPACAPYGYGYAAPYGGPVYGPSAYGGPVYGAPPPYYDPGPGVLLFGGGRDDRRPDDRRLGDRRPEDRGQVVVRRGGQRPQGNVIRGGRAAPAQRAVRRGGPAPSGHSSQFNPANPTAHGGDH